jgi:UDP-N-acetylglucosamine 4,6-dehydratase
MSYLITGGAGSLGRALVRRLTGQGEKVIVYSRDEGKHAKHFKGMKNVTCVIGDVRDFNRLDEVMSIYQISTVIHAAALKRIDDMELNPTECWKTNVVGSENVARAAMKNQVPKCMLISTDKACLPANVYGASKFVAERTFSRLNYNSLHTKLSAVRYGNVIASRGSFIPLWRDKLRNGEEIPITDSNCARFLFTLDDAVDFILTAVSKITVGGEVFIPKLKPYNIADVLNCLAEIEGVEEYAIKDIGVRPGEKLHEDMLAVTEVPNAWLIKDSDIIALLSSHIKRPASFYEKYDGPILNTSIDINKDMDELKSLIVRGSNESS